MEIPRRLASSIFERKGLYYFKSDQLSSDDSHHFILLEIDGQLLHLVVCSSRYEKCKKRIELRNQDFRTLVRVKSSSDNSLKGDSYVDCNFVFSQLTLENLENKFMNGDLKHTGYVTDAEYLEILTGVVASEDVEKGIIDKVQRIIDEFE